MDISFIIVNYNSSQFLEKCLASLKKHALPLEWEVIIVDNDTVPLNSDHAYPNLKIINNTKNEGFGKACNIGAAASSGKVFFFLNPDTEVLTSELAAITKILQNPNIGIVAPLLVTPKGCPQPWRAGYDMTPWEMIRNNVCSGRIKDHWSQKDVTDADWVSGAAIAITKDLFSEIGGFDENFFMYFEDVDLCRRVKKRDRTIAINPQLKVLHIGGQSYPDTEKQKNNYYASQDYYLKKNFGLMQFISIKLLRLMVLTSQRTLRYFFK